MSKIRRHWSSEDKIKLLRRHLIEKVPISTICGEERLAPSLFHRWQEQLFGNAALALEGNRRAERDQDQQRIEKLEQKIRQKDEVLAELMAEHISLNKNLGNSERMLGGAGSPRRSGGLYPGLGRKDRLGYRATAGMAGAECGQVLPLANATAGPTSITAEFPATSGYRIGKSRRSWISRNCTRRKDIDG